MSYKERFGLTRMTIPCTCARTHVDSETRRMETRRHQRQVKTGTLSSLSRRTAHTFAHENKEHIN
jgi:hypothetical protein